MSCFAAAVIIAAASVGSFQDALDLRDFDTAMELSRGLDSLMAEVFLESGEISLATALFQRAFDLSPSSGLLARLWSAAALSSENGFHLQAELLRQDLYEWNSHLQWHSSPLLVLSETASMLGDTVLSDSLGRVLVEEFPNSEDTYMFLGDRFYGALYPVWNDPEGRMEVLEEYLSQSALGEGIWRSRALGLILSSSLETADSIRWRDHLERWLACRDPRACLTGSRLLLERDSSFVEALELAETGLELMDSGWRPSGMPEDEWLLTGPALRRGLLMRKLMATGSLGDPAGAVVSIDSLTAAGITDMNDYRTLSSLYWLSGTTHLVMGDTSSAVEGFVRSAMEGDLRNDWTRRSIEKLKELLPGTEPVQAGRTVTGFTGPRFSDVTYLLGPDSLLSGSRVSWCDWNGDGYSDLFTGGKLYENMGGTDFRDVTEDAGLAGCGASGGIWGDLNGDGYADLVTSGCPSKVYINTGDRLVDMSDSLGMDTGDRRIEGVGLLDWNSDGILDIYLASYEIAGQMGTGSPDLFCLGTGSGFIPAADSLGMIPFLDEPLCGRGVSPCDWDRDGDMDIFVSNYRLQENFLWENDSAGGVNTALVRGVSGRNTDGWWGHTIGSAWGDYDNDGDWDLFSANLAHPRYITLSDRSMLLRNEDGSFTDVRGDAGIRFEETHSNPLWGDFDNDGLLDLFITSVYEERRSFLYRNTENGEFTDVTWLSGSRVMNGWGAAAADFNSDGRLDLAVGTGSGPVLLMNCSAENNWLEVRVRPGEGINPSAMGCTAEVEQNGGTYLRQVEGGSGTTSQSGGTLHFGLPGPEECRVRIYAPGVIEPVLETTSATNRILTVTIPDQS